MTFKVFISKTADSFLSKLDKENQERIREKLRLLAENPFSLPYKKVKGRQRTYRIRIGDFRVFYSIIGDEVLILKIDKRSRVYKR
jgi:mRNA interferase RelE/StbE